VLRKRHVLAVAGTHGKTTTASMLAWILADAGLKPGFLIGGVPANFDQRASAKRSFSSSRPMNTTPRFSTSVRSSSTTGRELRC
jgi:UDP-N-acetylmuramate: L-alanyl-gamma-D-glutamyl-meso-diaminopimelate ligase